MAYGTGHVIHEDAEKLRCLELFTNHILPSRFVVVELCTCFGISVLIF